MLYPSNVLTLVQLKLTPGLSEKVQKSVLNNVGSVVDSSSPPPGVKVELSGSPAFSQQMSAGLTSNMGILIGGALVLMIITMGILFSYVRHRFMPVLLVAIGLVTSLGLMGLFGINLNMAVIGAFPVLIGLGIDYAIQFHARFDEEARKGSLEDAVFMTVTRTGPAVMYAMLATSMGFLAMYVSTVPMIRSFGVVSIIGINTCFWISCIGMPTIALLVNYQPKQQQTGECYAVGTDACDTIIDNPKNQHKERKERFLLWPVPDRHLGEDCKEPDPGPARGCSYRPDRVPDRPDHPGRVERERLCSFGYAGQDQHRQGHPRHRGNQYRRPACPGFAGHGSRYRHLDQGVPGLRTVAPFGNDRCDQHRPYILQYNGGVMPETQAELDTVLAKIPEDTRKSVLSDPMCGIIRFSTTDLSMTQQDSLKEQVNKDIEFLEPPVGISVEPAGNFELMTSLLGAMSESKDTMTILGFIFVFVFLILVYRHLHAVSPIIPIIFVVGWNAVMMYVIGLTYNPLTATLGSMTIGVAAEYTILVMERYAEEEERLHDPIAAIQESVKKIGTAITVSGLATFFGFSALCLATFPIISNFGISTLIAVAFSLIGAIFIMPAVLSLVGSLDEWLKHRKNPGHEEKQV